jgi:hypothetical protein
MVSKVWNNNHLKLPLIIKSSSWRFIHDFSSFKSCNGIFIFTNSAHQVKYINYAKEDCVLEAIANAIESGKDFNSTLVMVIYTGSKNDSKVIANILIEYYNPINNSESKSPQRNITSDTDRIF